MGNSLSGKSGEERGLLTEPGHNSCLLLFRGGRVDGLSDRCIAVELQSQLLHIAVLFSIQGSALFGISRQGKRQPSLSLNNTDFRHWDVFLYLGGHRYWCSETSVRSRKYEHK